MPKKSQSVPILADPPRTGQHASSASHDFGRPVFLEGEDEAEYDRLLARVVEAVHPDDAIEEFWVSDIVELIWETLRLRRHKTNLLVASTATGLRRILEPLVEIRDLYALVESWYARDAASVKQVNALLKKAGLTMDHVIAQTFSEKLDDFERLDRMLAGAEARRHLVLREIDRHRSAIATRLRAAVEAIEEADYSDVLEGKTEHADAA
jgi:hypothetical protein